MTIMDLTEAYSGLRVCDLSQGVAGPHGTMMLAQFGADVIKIEPPGGDWARTLGGRYGDHSAHSYTFNRGKRSVAVDLKSNEGKDVVRRLIAVSDVFVESFRPGVAAKLGFSYEAVRTMQPSIVYASLSGFGQSGPYSKRGTVDALIQGFSGMMVMNQTPDGRPHRQNMTAVDVLSGLYLFSALSAAISQRRRTGCGGYIDVSLMQSAAAFQAAKIMEFHLSEGIPKPLYMPAGYLCTRDGAVSLATMRQEHYESLCNALKRPDLISDARFCDIAPRIQNGRILMTELEGETRKYDTTVLLELLQTAGILVERVQSYGEWIEDPHVKSTHAFNWIEHKDLGRIPVASTPGLTSGSSNRGPQAAPATGQHTSEILKMLDLLPSSTARSGDRETR
jgi:crotonobetainyl-CoA:carnitine CoA-transferase CaiB-like acyl-CoA transferase